MEDCMLLSSRTGVDHETIESATVEVVNNLSFSTNSWDAKRQTVCCFPRGQRSSARAEQ